MSRIRSDARREFLKHFCGTLAGGSALALLPQLKLIESASAATSGSGYKALVCVFLGGGNDSFNWLIPSDNTRYGVYQTARGGVYTGTNGPLGMAQGSLLPVNLQGPSGALPAGHAYGLHPACADWTAIDDLGVQSPMPGLQSLTNQGRVAWVANVGTLVVPLTKATYSNPALPKPPQLYSHNDQTNLWFQGRQTANFRYGWGGLVADLLSSQNTPIPGSSPPLTLPMNISFAGANRFQVGQEVFPYQMSACGDPNNTSGTSPTFPGSNVSTAFANCSGTNSLTGFRSCTVAGLNAQEQALCNLMTNPGNHPFQIEHADTMRRAMNLSAEIAADLTGNPNPSLLQTPFRALADNQIVTGYNLAADGNNSLAEQLAMVARLIKMRTQLGQNRNVFYVSLGGFDTHSGQMPDTGQPRLLRRVSRALGSFYRALEEMGVQNDVTTFTMSEFARTLNSNGDGSDHAWGGVQLVMGGAVRGGRLYGTWPDQTLNGPDSFSRGQTIPTTAMDQMAATLATWMGLSSTELAAVFPNLGNFSSPNLGFMV